LLLLVVVGVVVVVAERYMFLTDWTDWRLPPRSPPSSSSPPLPHHTGHEAVAAGGARG